MSQFRFKLTSDFGYVALDIAHTVPEDSGTYSVKAINRKVRILSFQRFVFHLISCFLLCVFSNNLQIQGEAEVQGSLSVRGNAGILTDTLHDQSLQKIRMLEVCHFNFEEFCELMFFFWDSESTSPSLIVLKQNSYKFVVVFLEWICL